MLDLLLEEDRPFARETVLPAALTSGHWEGELQPQVIFLDIVMPDLTAFEVFAELKADPETADIPVVNSTSKRLEADERRRLAETTAAILDKNTPSRQEAVARSSRRA